MFLALGIFGTGRVLHLCLDHNLPTYTSQVVGMTGVCHHTQLLLVEIGSLKVFAQADLEL
jgi:hypothetical protein